MEMVLSACAHTPSLLWTIFKPGDVLHVPQEESLYELSSGEQSYGMQGEFNLNIEFVSWNGECLVYGSKNFQIPRTTGTIKILNLPIYPIEFHGDSDTIKAIFLKRGGRFVALRGVHAKVLKRSVGKGLDVPGINAIRPPVS
jgi:hypothetical protein